MPTLSTFTLFWLVVSSLIVAIDASYVLLMPATQNTGAIPYTFWDLYATFDKRYASKEDAFGFLQSSLNVFEITFAMVIVLMDVLINRGGKGAKKKSSLPLKLAIVQQMMVFYKTVIYLGLEHTEGYAYTRHNSTFDSVVMVLIPSSFWITVPAYVMYDCFGKLTITGGAAAAASPAKKQK